MRLMPCFLLNKLAYVPNKLIHLGKNKANGEMFIFLGGALLKAFKRAF